MYYIYMLRCQDESIYTGITTNLLRRMEEHFEKQEKCAKYTFTHTARKLEIVWETETRALASKLEYHLKKITKKQKESLIEKKQLAMFLANKIEENQYHLVNQKEMKKINQIYEK